MLLSEDSFKVLDNFVQKRVDFYVGTHMEGVNTAFATMNERVDNVEKATEDAKQTESQKVKDIKEVSDRLGDLEQHVASEFETMKEQVSAQPLLREPRRVGYHEKIMIKHEVDEAVASAMSAMKYEPLSRDARFKDHQRSLRDNPDITESAYPGDLTLSEDSECGHNDDEVEPAGYDIGERWAIWGDLPEHEILIQDFLVTCDESMIVTLQAYSRGLLLRRQLVQASFTLNVQSQSRGTLQRRRFARILASLQDPSAKKSIIAAQAVARCIFQRTRYLKEVSIIREYVLPAAIKIQALARGILSRRESSKLLRSLDETVPFLEMVQARLQSVLTRWWAMTIGQYLAPSIQPIITLQAIPRGILFLRRYNRSSNNDTTFPTLAPRPGRYDVVRMRKNRLLDTFAQYRDISLDMSWVVICIARFKLYSLHAVLEQWHTLFVLHMHQKYPQARDYILEQSAVVSSVILCVFDWFRAQAFPKSLRGRWLRMYCGAGGLLVVVLLALATKSWLEETSKPEMRMSPPKIRNILRKGKIRDGFRY